MPTRLAHRPETNRLVRGLVRCLFYHEGSPGFPPSFILHIFSLHRPWMIQELLCLLQIVINFLFQLYLGNPLLSKTHPAGLQLDFHRRWMKSHHGDAWIHKLWMQTDALLFCLMTIAYKTNCGKWNSGSPAPHGHHLLSIQLENPFLNSRCFSYLAGGPHDLT